MNKLLKTLLVIGVIAILIIMLIGGVPSTNSEFSFFIAFLLLILGFYLANYSNYRRIGISIAIISSLPLLIFVASLFGGLLLGWIIGPGDIVD